MGPALGVLAFEAPPGGGNDRGAHDELQARRVRWACIGNCYETGYRSMGPVVLSNLFTIGSRLQTFF